MKISYYELLGMIENGNVPKKIEVSLTYTTKAIYKADYDGDDFSLYHLAEYNLADENYKMYLSECFLESMMFDKCIEIIEEDKEIKKLDKSKFYDNRFPDDWEEEIINKIDELVMEVRKLKKEGK